jgi:peptide/nickel transport system substrate-binding protein
MWSYLRFRYRRNVRRYRREVRLIRTWSANYWNRHIWGKWHQAHLVRRFLFFWWIIVAVAAVGVWQQIGSLTSLIDFAVAEPGGTYSEAAVGTVTTLNPLLPESDTALDIDSLVFSGLTRYNSRGQIVPDLATWNVSSDGMTYTFHLRHGVKWQDGVPFTSADVAFTLTAIQNPDSRSPLESSWQGVKVTTQGDYTVTFVLPQPLNSFLDSTTVGIVPAHLLENIDPSQLATASFNQHPVGTGPFEIKTFAPSAGEIELTANPYYYFGRPKLDEFDFKFYDSLADTLNAYAQHQVTSPGRILPSTATEASQQVGLSMYNFTLPEEETLFFNNTDPLLQDKTLRQILSRSLNRNQIVERAENGQGVPQTQPLLPSQLGYTAKYAPTELSVKDAAAALSADGWTQSRAGVTRVKNGQKLQFKLVTLAGSELATAAQEVKQQWAPLGVDITVVTTDETDLQQSYMRPRNFQMLLFGVNVGSDPDVYAYWHSSQAQDPGVNLSQYNDSDADKALEDGRIKSDPKIRIEKYDEFLKDWNADAPAAVLYQVGYTYATSNTVSGIAARHLISPSDRYYDVNRWTVRQRITTNF